jgi:hypothetical protein
LTCDIGKLGSLRLSPGFDGMYVMFEIPKDCFRSGYDIMGVSTIGDRILMFARDVYSWLVADTL